MDARISDIEKALILRGQGATQEQIGAALEAHGRALCLRRYPAQRLWRVLPPKGTRAIVSAPVSGYGAQSEDDFTQWELSA
jgi:hypothetical protein